MVSCEDRNITRARRQGELLSRSTESSSSTKRISRSRGNSTVGTASHNIRVGIRIRPLSPVKGRKEAKSIWEVDRAKENVALGDVEEGIHASNPRMITTIQQRQMVLTGNDEFSASPYSTLGGFGSARTKYQFDYVCTENENTASLYHKFARPLVMASCAGYNASIFCYGQTSSGKTYTTLGTEEEPGLVLLSFSQLFHHIQSTADCEFRIRVSYVEIYNEAVNDLIGGGRDLRLIAATGEDPDALTGSKVAIQGLKYATVRSPKDFVELLLRGEHYRKVGNNDVNERSSRSHTIFRVHIDSRPAKGRSGTRAAAFSSVLSLVDLAGSENIAFVGDKLRQSECRHINRSLLGLSRVILKLSSNESKQHIPYRDSKLTRILEHSLGGNSLTAVIGTIKASKDSLDESHHTLRFASFAQRISTRLSRNLADTFSSSGSLKDQAMMQKYEGMLATLKEKVRHYSQQAKAARVYEQQLQTLSEENRRMHEHIRTQELKKTRLREQVDKLQNRLKETMMQQQQPRHSNSPSPSPSLGRGETSATQIDVNVLREQLTNVQNAITALAGHFRGQQVWQDPCKPDAKSIADCSDSAPSAIQNVKITLASLLADDDEEDVAEESGIAAFNELPSVPATSIEDIKKGPEKSSSNKIGTGSLPRQSWIMDKFFHGRALGSHPCKFSLVPQKRQLRWYRTRDANESPLGKLAVRQKKLLLDEVCSVSLGRSTPVFRKNHERNSLDQVNLSFSLLTPQRSLDVVARSQKDFNDVLTAIRHILPADIPVYDNRPKELGEDKEFSNTLPNLQYA